MKRRITNTLARNARCPADRREIFIRDTELRGFGLRVSRSVTTFIYETSITGKSKRPRTIAPAKLDAKSSRRSGPSDDGIEVSRGTIRSQSANG